MRFVSFSSSSKGNCAFISYKNTNILVDAGISKKRLVEYLSRYNKTLDDIDYIFVTHEHYDHIAAIPMILKEKNIKIVSQRATLLAINNLCEKNDVKLDPDIFIMVRPMNTLDTNNYIKTKDIKVCPVKSSHDVPSVFYKFILGDVKFAIMTDIGVYTDYTIRSISDVSYLMLECNYDYDMLMKSKYAPYLKSRIAGDKGHLSNRDSAEVIMKLANNTLKKVFLSHISDESNSEDYALEYVTKYLAENYNGEYKLPDINICNRTCETIIYDDTTAYIN